MNIETYEAQCRETVVTLYLLEAHFEQAKKEIPRFKKLVKPLDVGYWIYSEFTEDNEEIEMVKVEVEGMTNPDLGVENMLRAKRIPYDKFWGAGVYYGAGEEYYRVLTDGTPVLKRFGYAERFLLSTGDVYDAYAKGVDDTGVDHLLDLIEAKVDDSTNVSWPQQIVWLDLFKAERILKDQEPYYLMNPATGSVDEEENWMLEMYTWAADPVKCMQQFGSLVNVEKNDKGDWVEVSGAF